MTRRTVLITALIVASVVLAAMSLVVGASDLDFGQALADWRAGKTALESPTLSVLIHQRLLRTLVAIVAGAGLALAGCSFQALLRNPLATPYTLGIASFGAFGAWTATIVAQWAATAS